MKEHKYLVVIEWAGGNFAASSPDLPGCITTGATEEETAENMKEAIAAYLEDRYSRGFEIPADTAATKAYFITVPEPETV